MTKAEAKAMLKRIQEPEAWEPQINQAAFEALDMAIEALSCSEFPNSSDTIYRQAAIDAIHEDAEWLAAQGSDWQVERMERDKSILKSLPTVQPTQTNCEYCHTDRDGYILPLEKNCHAYISRGMNGWVIELKANGWRGEAKIKYCPICGRRLVHG